MLGRTSDLLCTQQCVYAHSADHTTSHVVHVYKLVAPELQATPEKERAAMAGTLAPLRAAAEPHAGGPAAYARHTALQVLKPREHGT
jgi:Ni,Fe-hydrogenase I large subunit